MPPLSEKRFDPIYSSRVSLELTEQAHSPIPDLLQL
jgi:hypothetical protein